MKERYTQKTDGYGIYFIGNSTGIAFKRHDIVYHQSCRYPYAIVQFDTSNDVKNPRVYTSNNDKEFGIIWVQLQFGSQTIWTYLSEIHHKEDAETNTVLSNNDHRYLLIG